MSGVTRHCSILNYIRQVDPDLYEIIQDLCIGRMFLPKKGMGLTFLRPDKGLVDELKKMIKAGKEEDALDAIRASLIRDHVETLSELAAGGYQNALRRAVPSGKLEGSKFIFSNDSVAQMDSFQRRTDRESISVFILSGKFLPTDTAEISDEKKAAPKKAKGKRGGGDFGDARVDLFNLILAKQVMHYPKRDFAKEVLVSLLDYVEANDVACLACLQSQLSYDALTSLAIILQPYRSPTYISDDLYGKWKSLSASFDIISADLYCGLDPKKKYIEHMETARKANGDLCKKVNDVRKEFYDTVNKLTFVSELNKAYAKVKVAVEECKGLSSRTDITQMIAEAELRVAGASLLADRQDKLDYEQGVRVFTSHTLNGPYYFTDPRVTKNYNAAFWFSNPATLANSDGFFYLPGLLRCDMINITAPVYLGDFDYSQGGTIELACEKCLGDDLHFNNYFNALQTILERVKKPE